MSIEYCARCGEATGNGGVWDGSLIYEGDPYCENCYVPTIIKICEESLYAITRLQAEVQRLTAENEKLAKIFDEQSTLTDNAEAERDAMREQLKEKANKERAELSQLVTSLEEDWSVIIDLGKDNAELREQLRWRKWPDEKPPSGVNVLIRYTNDLNKTRTIRGCWLPQWFSESHDDEFAEYHEERDEYYTPEGWYEMVETDVGMDYTDWFMGCQTPEAWLPIPQE